MFHLKDYTDICVNYDTYFMFTYLYSELKDIVILLVVIAKYSIQINYRCQLWFLRNL